MYVSAHFIIGSYCNYYPAAILLHHMKAGFRLHLLKNMKNGNKHMA